jgi:hypothetical protein
MYTSINPYLNGFISKNNRMKKLNKLNLIELESLYGGFIKNVPRKKVSPLDHRTTAEINRGGMTGGDRMSPNYHNYSPIYEKYLQKFDQNQDLTIVEIGILKGTGLAIWSTLFPNSKIIGLDIDPSLALSNLDFLKNKGANIDNIEIHELDQLIDFSESLKGILKNKRIDIMIDDGLHSDLAILNTIKHTLPFLNENFTYLIEDNNTAHKIISHTFKKLTVENYGLMTVLTQKSRRNQL